MTQADAPREPTAAELAHVYDYVRRVLRREIHAARVVLNREGVVAIIPEGRAEPPPTLNTPPT